MVVPTLLSQSGDGKTWFSKKRISHSTLSKVHFSGGGPNVGSRPCGLLDGGSFLVEVGSGSWFNTEWDALISTRNQRVLCPLLFLCHGLPAPSIQFCHLLPPSCLQLFFPVSLFSVICTLVLLQHGWKLIWLPGVLLVYISLFEHNHIII